MIKVSPRTKKTSFQVSYPEAQSVTVVGDFNGWSGEATPMKKNRSGVWKADLVLEAGDYQFRYLVNNDQWLNDEEVPSVPNSFGTENNVLHVEFPAPKKKTAAKKTTAKKTTTRKTATKKSSK